MQTVIQEALKLTSTGDRKREKGEQETTIMWHIQEMIDRLKWNTVKLINLGFLALDWRILLYLLPLQLYAHSIYIDGNKYIYIYFSIFPFDI